MPLSEESVRELVQTLNDLKTTNSTMVVKMDQIYDSIEKLEKTVETISTAVSSQEKRLTVIEQSVPANLLQDLAVLKATQESQSKILWLVGSGTAVALIQALIKAIH